MLSNKNKYKIPGYEPFNRMAQGMRKNKKRGVMDGGASLVAQW